MNVIVYVWYDLLWTSLRYISCVQDQCFRRGPFYSPMEATQDIKVPLLQIQETQLFFGAGRSFMSWISRL